MPTSTTGSLVPVHSISPGSASPPRYSEPNHYSNHHHHHRSSQKEFKPTLDVPVESTPLLEVTQMSSPDLRMSPLDQTLEKVGMGRYQWKLLSVLPSVKVTYSNT